MPQLLIKPEPIAVAIRFPEPSSGVPGAARHRRVVVGETVDHVTRPQSVETILRFSRKLG